MPKQSPRKNKGPSAPKTRPSVESPKNRYWGYSLWICSAVAGLIAFFIGLDYFTPRLVIADIHIGDDMLASESRIEFCNEGNVPLRRIRLDYDDITYQSADVDIRDSSLHEGLMGDIGNLDAKGSLKVEAVPKGYVFEGEVPADECSFVLHVNYTPRFIFFDGPRQTKSWRVQLRSPKFAPIQWYWREL